VHSTVAVENMQAQGHNYVISSGATLIQRFEPSRAPIGSTETSFDPANSAGVIPNTFRSVLSDWQLWLNGEDSFGLAGARYRELLAKRYDTIRILGMDAPVPLRSIYVRVNILKKITARHNASVHELEEFFQGDKRGFGIAQETTTALEAVNRLPNILLLGKPGAGKSTFLKYLALLASDGELATPRVPIFISLKEWSDSGDTLIQFVARQFEICGFSDPLPYVRRLLVNKGCLILLDGFDEVTGNVSKAIDQIKDFYNGYAGNQFILSCRVAAYDYIFEQFTEIELADFEDREIETFINNWFNQSARKAASCWTELKADQSIHELARSPLLLTMLCLTFDDQMAFPHNRAELYFEAVNALLKKWDSSRDIKRQEIYKQLTPMRKIGLLSNIAFHTFKKEQHFIRSTDVESYIRDYVEHLPGSIDNEQVDYELIVRSIEAQHGLLVERAKGIYSFSHLTLQEYFATRYILEHWSEEDLNVLLLDRAFEPKWREVILLSTEMLPSAEDFLRKMRDKITGLVNPNVHLLLGEIGKCVRPGAPNPNRARAWTLAFILDRLNGVQLAGKRSSGVSSDYPKELFPSDWSPRSIALSGDSTEDLGPIRDRALAVARAMDPTFDLGQDLKRRPDIRDAVDIYRALEYVRARDRVKYSYRSLDKYLYGTELVFQCLKSDCFVSRAIRTEISDTLLFEPVLERNTSENS